MSAKKTADIAELNQARKEERAMKRRLVESGWHYLIFKGAHEPLHMRCAERMHAVRLTPTQALNDGCPTCKLMDAPTETVTVARLKADVAKQDAEHMKSLMKSRRRMVRGYGLDQYWGKN